MKKILAITFAIVLTFSLAACAKTPANSSAPATSTAEPATVATPAAETPKTVTIKTFNSERKLVDLEVPYNPQRIAVMDLAALDMLDSLGLGDRVVAVSKGSSIDYLQKYVANDKLINLGTIKEADLEAVMSSEPDIIFIGTRLAAQYDTLSKIAPVVFLGMDTEAGLVESIRKNAETTASIFGVANTVNDKMKGFEERIAKLSAVAQGKTAVIGMSTAGGFNILGNNGHASMIGMEIGFNNLAASEITSGHGNESSFEYLVELNPDYIFVIDRDAAIKAQGAQLAREVMENELVMKTDAYKNGNIVYLGSPAVWYTADGGITALDIMLADLEGTLLN